jgi:hypothetical protein
MAAQLKDDEPVLMSDFDGSGSLEWWQSVLQCDGRAQWE